MTTTSFIRNGLVVWTRACGEQAWPALVLGLVGRKQWRLRLLLPSSVTSESMTEVIEAEETLEEYSAHLSLTAPAKVPALKKLLAAACCEVHTHIKQNGLFVQRTMLTALPEFAQFDEALRKVAYWDPSDLNALDRKAAMAKVDKDIESGHKEIDIVNEALRKAREDLIEKQTLLAAVNLRISNVRAAENPIPS